MRHESPDGLTYPEVGATRDDRLPPGYGHLHRDVVIGRGRRTFDEAVDGLFEWRMHRGAGLRVVGSPSRAAPGVTVTLRAGWLTVPCRVVYTVDEPRHSGFAYGTLAGHPEQGEEAFLVMLSEVDDVRFAIRAFSRPASLLARLGGPLTRVAQSRVTNRYVNALRSLANESG